MTAEIDESICPICQQANRCGVVANRCSNACWCMETEIPTELLVKIPNQFKGKNCICKHCIDRFRNQQSDTNSSKIRLS